MTYASTMMLQLERAYAEQCHAPLPASEQALRCVRSTSWRRTTLNPQLAQNGLAHMLQEVERSQAPAWPVGSPAEQHLGIAWLVREVIVEIPPVTVNTRKLGLGGCAHHGCEGASHDLIPYAMLLTRYRS